MGANRRGLRYIGAEPVGFEEHVWDKCWMCGRTGKEAKDGLDACAKADREHPVVLSNKKEGFGGGIVEVFPSIDVVEELDNEKQRFVRSEVVPMFICAGCEGLLYMVQGVILNIIKERRYLREGSVRISAEGEGDEE